MERAIWLAEAVQPKVAVDFLVYTPAEWRQLKAEGSGFIRQIVEKRKVLYEKGT